MLNAQRLAAKWLQIEETYCDVDVANVQAARADIELKKVQALFDELTQNGVLTIPGTGLFAGQVAITGNSITGKIS